MPEHELQHDVEARLSDKERFQVLLAEMQLLQGRFDKYDDLFFRSRNWLVTIIIALLGVAITDKTIALAILSIIIIPVFYILEVSWRRLYQYKYIERYEFIRNHLHDDGAIIGISPYDLTHHFGPPSKIPEMENLHGVWECFKNTHFRKHIALKVELILFYGGLLFISLVSIVMLIALT